MNKRDAAKWLWGSEDSHLHGPGWFKEHVLYDEHYWWAEWYIFWLAFLITILVIAA